MQMKTDTSTTLKVEIPHVFSNARKSLGITQIQLSRETGIAQCDISRIETGQANPSIRTLTRLAAGMGMNIKLELLPLE